MKTPRLFLLVSASMALTSAQNTASYTFSQGETEPQVQTFELLRTSYVAPATPVVVLPTPTAAGSPTTLTPTASTMAPPPTGSLANSECPMMCTAMFKPVCGSNGKTYSNACELSAAQCRNPTAKITVMAEGECTEDTSTPATPAPSQPEPTTTAPSVPTASEPPQTTTAPAPAATTAAPSTPAATTTTEPATPSVPKCPQMCTSDFTPLCGSDGKTYSNACEFAVARCQNPQINLTKAADGECGAGAITTPEPEPQAPVSTPAASSSKCTQACSSDFTPLCGSDGKTYSNACALSVAQCENPSANLVKASEGECGGGSSSSGASPAPSTPGAGVTLAPVSASPVTKTPTLSESKCEMACVKMFAPVCGSNGMIYNNVCELRLANCKSGSSVKVTIASQGACGAATVKLSSTEGSTTATTAASTTSTTTTAVVTGGAKDGYLRGSGNSPFQGQ